MILIVTLVTLIVSHSVLSPEEMENGIRKIIDEDFKISEEIEALAKEAELDSLPKKSLEKYKATFEIFKTWQR